MSSSQHFSYSQIDKKKQIKLQEVFNNMNGHWEGVVCAVVKIFNCNNFIHLVEMIVQQQNIWTIFDTEFVCVCMCMILCIRVCLFGFLV